MLWTGSLYVLVVEISLADANARLSLPPNIDEIPQLEPAVLTDKHCEACHVLRKMVGIC